MGRFVEGADRGQATLLPECLDDWIDEDNPVRAVDVFVDALDLAEMGFDGVEPAATGRPGYNPATLLKLYIYGYLNRVQSSRRLEREAGRNLELLWLLGRLVPDQRIQSLKAVCEVILDQLKAVARDGHAATSITSRKSFSEPWRSAVGLTSEDVSKPHDGLRK